MTTISKRLHISGITPGITASDINARLGGFGKVLDLDGLGILNAVGEPRRFVYVTLEATEANLARCLNVLSGTTWKGTKLRIGEAKPDYAKRLEIERKRASEGEDPQRSSKRKRLPRGVQGVHANDMSTVGLENMLPGWHKTTLSHLIRPIKMRPSHPLPEPVTQRKVGTKKNTNKKPGTHHVPTRSRVRVIDPRLHGAVHLRGNMLESVVIALPVKTTPHPSVPSDVPAMAKPDARDVSESPSIPGSVASPDLAHEKERDLGLLMTIFGDAEDWGEKESIENEAAGEPAKTDATEKPKIKALKDMFQPHEEEAGFSLLANLGDLDFDPDLDLDPAFILGAPTATRAPITPVIPVEVPPQRQENLILDNSLPFFFPQPDNPRAKDIFSIARSEGWEFGRSGDSDAIRKRWDETKGPLTREWKKRAREAVKFRKRRYGAAEGEEA